MSCFLGEVEKLSMSRIVCGAQPLRELSSWIHPRPGSARKTAKATPEHAELNTLPRDKASRLPSLTSSAPASTCISIACRSRAVRTYKEIAREKPVRTPLQINHKGSKLLRLLQQDTGCRALAVRKRGAFIGFKHQYEVYNGRPPMSSSTESTITGLAFFALASTGAMKTP